jgi:homoserine O-acetyltransferase/O-succinyltransferase
MIRFILCASLCLAASAANYPNPVDHVYIARNFRFGDGETMAQLRLHTLTIGQPVRDHDGVVRNAVLIMHGTTGHGRGFLTEAFAGHLFGPGQLLDATKYYIILPDAIGHGKSSRPSDGLHAHFPKYDYDDMVRADHLMLTEGLHVNHLRLVMGTSMGGMHTWVWGEMYPDFMDALMPLASAPVQIAGWNRMLRNMVMDSIRDDPGWDNGDYKKEPHGLVNAVYILMVMVASPLHMYHVAPTRDQADALFQKTLERRLKGMDANDMLYAFNASRNYNPAPDLEKIQAPLIAINSADDEINPPQLGILPREIKDVKRGRYVLLPITGETRGHVTHSLPAIWGKYLGELLQESETPATRAAGL